LLIGFNVMVPILEQNRGGLICGEEHFFAYSPEREDPGNPDFTAAGIPKVVGGYDSTSCELAVKLYSQAIVQVIPVASAEIAEACKILENTYRAVNIALVNELKTLFDRMGIDIWEVVDAAKTKPFGFQAFYPGPGLGGHCILPVLAGPALWYEHAIYRAGGRSEFAHASLRDLSVGRVSEPG
jgi:UDP-N-acetyl-D-glucosamine dehydrogenase